MTGTGIWAALLAYLGYFLGTEYTQVSEYLDPVSWIVFVAVGVLYFVRVIRHKGPSKERAASRVLWKLKRRILSVSQKRNWLVARVRPRRNTPMGKSTQ
jgi:hypothetical protein